MAFSGVFACLLSSFWCFCFVLSMEGRPKSYRKASSSHEHDDKHDESMMKVRASVGSAGTMDSGTITN